MNNFYEKIILIGGFKRARSTVYLLFNEAHKKPDISAIFIKENFCFKIY